MNFKRIDVSPFTTNILDLIDSPGLVTKDGTSVFVSRTMRGDFVINIGGEITVTDSNTYASGILNNAVVGMLQ